MSARKAAVAVVVGLVLGVGVGCSQESQAITDAASQDMTAGVVAVADAASAGDLQEALTALDTVQQQLDTATAGEDVTADRAARIQLSLDVVRADLETLVAAQSAAAAPTDGAEDPAETTVPVETSEPVAPVPEPVQPAPEAPAPPKDAPKPSGPAGGGPAGPDDKPTGKTENKGKGKGDG